MYKQGEYEALDAKAKWKEVDREVYFKCARVAKRADLDMCNIYIRDDIDAGVTEWSGILRYCIGTNIPWMKYVKRPEGYNKYYINCEVQEV